MQWNYAATIGASPVIVGTADANDAFARSDQLPYAVFNLGAVPIYVGGPSVGTALAAPVAAGGQYNGVLYQGESVYAITATGFAFIAYTAAGVNL